jgi:hypothetical protein
MSSTEAERDVMRATLRQVVGSYQESLPRMSPADRALVVALDALLMADRIEVGGSVVALMGLEEYGKSDEALSLLTRLVRRVDPIGCTNPELN